MLDETVDEPIISASPVKKDSLCSKYDISIDKLSFEYISDCNNVKELERIVKILRSGEEGYYPDLQKHAEKQLQTLAPNSRLLRVEEPVVKKESLMPEQRDQVDNDMKQWLHDMSSKDEELMDWNKNYHSETGSGDFIPPVRRAPQPKVDNSKQQPNSKNVKKPVVSDYATWQKYDADAELVKMEAEEERQKMEKEIELRKQKIADEASHKKAEHSRLNCLINVAKTMPDAERTFHALSEKDRGNEYYKTCNYDDAIDYYTASIAIAPNPVAYNNRAASYLKQGKYDLALSDVNKCLELDPGNTKGLYRRGLCLQHKNRFDEALRDMQAVLRKEPNNLLVQHVSKELRQQCRSVPRSVRMLVEEKEDDNKVVEMSENEARRMKVGIEVNDWGLARNMCSCYGRPLFLRTLNRSGVADHLIYKPEEEEENSDKEIVSETETSALQNQPELENLVCKSPITEMICNGTDTDEPMETNRIVFGRNSDNEADELIPKKIKIIETVKANNDLSGGVKERDKPKNCVVKDMRGQKYIQGQKELEMMEQFSNITIDEPVMADSITESTNENKNRKLNTKHKQNNNQENNERNNQSQQNRVPVINYEFHVPSEKQPISIASKYTQKVGSAKNFNAQNECAEYRNINNINNISNIVSSDSTYNESSISSPIQFFRAWSSVKDTNSFKEYANILRKIQPSRLASLLGNKLDDSMFLAMIKALYNEFDNTDRAEADLVKQYLVELSKVERFLINVQFLSSDLKQLTSCLIDKVGGDDALELKKKYELV